VNSDNGDLVLVSASGRVAPGCRHRSWWQVVRTWRDNCLSVSYIFMVEKFI